MKVKFANKVYEVLYTMKFLGKPIYAVEDEPNHIDWLVNVEVVDAEKKELKVSDGERVRKNLIELFHDTVSNDEIFSDYGLDKTEVLAWLEKQGNNADKVKQQQDIEIPFGAKDSELQEATYHIPEGYHAEINGNEVVIKKGEQKPVDKVEPKFKVGDWIVNKFHDICLITDIDLENSYYICKSNRFDNTEGDIDLTDKEFHLWIIEDAKDGDVLAAPDDSVFIFARVDNYSCIYHIALTNDGVLRINPLLISAWANVRGVKPATKEQHDLLFQKMKEEGYEWNKDKKELIKL